MSTTPTAQVTIAGHTVTVELGTPLPRLCDEHGSSIVFGCRSARCGVCLVTVVVGAGNLGPAGDRELDVLSLIADTPDDRLACQCVIHGDVTLDPHVAQTAPQPTPETKTQRA